MLRRGARLDPGTVRRFEAIGRALIGTRRFAAAIDVLEAGVAEAQDDVRMLTLLAKLRASCPDATLRDGHRALQYAERACELQQWADPDALDGLAAAHFALGHVDQAVKTARQAMQLARQQGNSKLAAGIARRLRMYEAASAPPGSSERPTLPDR
jgi:tetratricopeptide (TPR) repeat protein